MAFRGAIWIKGTAAGYGWFLYPSPAKDSAFPAAAGSPTYRKVDLLTMVEHGLGHEFGFADTAGHGLMVVFPGIGVRRVPAAASPATARGGTAPVLLGAAVAQPAVVLSAEQERVTAAVPRRFLSEGMSFGTVPAAPPRAAIAWLAERDLALQQTSASGTWPLTLSADGLASARDAVFAWLEDNDRLFSDPLAVGQARSGSVARSPLLSPDN
jgi:hypothetical protein